MSLPLEILLGHVPVFTFEDQTCGLCLLASQLRDSFFELQREEAGPSLAIVTKNCSPARIISECIPELPVEGLGDSENYVVTILASAAFTGYVQRTLFEIWARIEVGKEVPDLIGGILTIEGVYKGSKKALYQVIKLENGWAQYRVHPFSRDDSGVASLVGTPIVEGTEDGPLDFTAFLENNING